MQRSSLRKALPFYCLLILGGIFFAICQKSNALSLQEKLRQIPTNERFILERFFQIIIKSDGLGYVLFGSKPVCLSAYFETVPMGNVLSGCNSNAIKRGWQVWKKYEKQFPHPQYLIFEELKIVDGAKLHYIFFINKIKLVETVNKHHHFFVDQLGLPVDPKNLLTQIEKGSSLMETLNRHEGLLGILLGYGVESSMHYHQRNLARDFGLPIAYSESDFQAVSYSKPFPLRFEIQPIHFSGNAQSQEVKEIIHQNLKEQSSLHDIFSQGSYLEIALKKLMEL